MIKTRVQIYWIIHILWVFAFACADASFTSKNSPTFQVLSPDHTGIEFQNRLRESPSQNVLGYEYFYNGAGLAIADFNQDDLPDIYFISNLEQNHFYLNKGKLRFDNQTTTSGLAGKRGFYTGVTTVDINADGLMDIYACKSGRFSQTDPRRNELYINIGNDAAGIPRFREAAAEYGLDIPSYSTQTSFFDYDQDGDLDMFLINHDIDTYPLNDIPVLGNTPSTEVGDMLFENQAGKFVDVTQAAGLANNKLGFGLGIAVGDVNHDSWPDVYVSTDYSGKDHLYINRGDGTFKEMIRELSGHISFNSMGNDIGDINNDGWPDIVNLDMVAEDNYGIKTSMSAMNPEQFRQTVKLGQHYQYMFNTLLLNSGVQGKGDLPHFSDVGQMLGISNTDWSWAPLLFDFDNDGWKDLFVTNGIKRNIRNNDAVAEIKKRRQLLQQNQQAVDRVMYIQETLNLFPYHRKPNYFYQNKGNLQFENITSHLGLDSLDTASNGAAYADLDRDGDLDLVVNNVDQLAMVFQNTSRDQGAGNYLQIALEGPEGNPFGIGTRVVVKQAGKSYSTEMYTSRGYLSSVEPLLQIGLGASVSVENITITWPDGKVQTVGETAVNQAISISYAPGDKPGIEEDPAPSMFELVAHEEVFAHQHVENVFDDFLRESLLPHKMSQVGPATAIGDVNQDGLEDVFIGGAKGFAAQMYIQGAAGTMRPVSISTWEKDSEFEDVSAALFDADGDSDLDLVVGSGGNEGQEGDVAFALRVYENDGKGGFRKRDNSFHPYFWCSTSVIRPHDIDGDGDLDLFVGARQVPGIYPYNPTSHIMINESKDGRFKFVDGNQTWAPLLIGAGMVTDARWADFDGDEKKDLLLVGEWMHPRLFLHKDTYLKESSVLSGLSDKTGWWFSLTAGDVDKDGDIDFIAGNLGLNYKYKSSKEAPFEVYANDFDDNGSLDIVLGYYDEGDLYPLRGRECSAGQMPFIKTKFPSYDAFGKATLTEVLDQKKMEAAVHHRARTFASTYFENIGKGRFVAKALPNAAQLSSINSILLQDFDADGTLDLLVAGNLYGAEVETPRNDASIGLWMKGDGKGGFDPVSYEKSGVKIIGEVRSLIPLKLTHQKKQHILIVKNNEWTELLRY